MSNPQFKKVIRILQDANVTFGNLEESLINPRQQAIWPANENGGTPTTAPPSVGRFLKDIGFNMVSRANNHTTDWGIRGMEDTGRLLDRVGIVHAGTGTTLAAARAPAYLTTKWGQVALVATTSSFTGMEPAGAPYRGLVGRPGASVLRTTRTVFVTSSQMRALVSIYNGRARDQESPVRPDVRSLDLFGVHYRTRASQGEERVMNSYDLDGILRNVREGKEDSNFEIMYIHSHQPGNWSEKPASFMRKLAHDAINAGADEFIASGPHRLRGIEIYKGKPIFYSLGNFFFMGSQQPFFYPPLEPRLLFGLDPSTTTVEEDYERLLKLQFNGVIWYGSIIAVSTFNADGSVRLVTLYPVDLGYQRDPAIARGMPYLASHDRAQEILHLLQRLSRPFGTQIRIKGNVGVISVHDSRPSDLK